MKEERWEEVRDLIKKQFTIDYEGVEDLEDSPGSMEVMEFEGPLGLMRVEYVSKPRQIGRKVHGSKRIGAESREEVLFSDTDTVSHLLVYVHDDEEGTWNEMDADLFGAPSSDESEQAED